MQYGDIDNVNLKFVSNDNHILTCKLSYGRFPVATSYNYVTVHVQHTSVKLFNFDFMDSIDGVCFFNGVFAVYMFDGVFLNNDVSRGAALFKLIYQGGLARLVRLRQTTIGGYDFVKTIVGCL